MELTIAYTANGVVYATVTQCAKSFDELVETAIKAGIKQDLKGFLADFEAKQKLSYTVPIEGA